MDALNRENLNGRLLETVFDDLTGMWERYEIDSVQLLGGLLHLRSFGWR